MDYTNELDSLGLKIEDGLKDILAQEVEAATDYHPFMGESFDDCRDHPLPRRHDWGVWTVCIVP